jgi:DNA-binding MarR family transcriptional regulator
MGGQGGAGIELEDFQRVAEVRSALRGFLRRSEAVARKHGLTPQRYLLLLMIKGAPNGTESSTVSELCERLRLAQSTVTELVQRAEEAGLLRRDPSEEDGRVAHLYLTDEGEARLGGAFGELRSERDTLIRVVSVLRRAEE